MDRPVEEGLARCRRNTYHGNSCLSLYLSSRRMATPQDSTSSQRRPGVKRVQEEIGQSRPFVSRRQEAAVSLLRTASVIRRYFERVVEPFGLSLAQYNALRIVRGAGSGGIATLAIRERMLEEGTTITRLLDKLETAGLVRRERALPDRRQVICYVTDEGDALLGKINPKVDAGDAIVVENLSDDEVEELVRLLDEVRAGNAVRGAARSMMANPRRDSE